MGVLPRNPRSIPKPSTLVLDNRQTFGWAIDSVSAAASVVALVETSLKVVSLCAEYYSHVKNANHLAEQQCRHFSADIACYNGPRNFVIAGDDVSIQATEKRQKLFRPVSGRYLLS